MAGYYAWTHRPAGPGPRAQRYAAYTRLITEEFTACQGRAGRRLIRQRLQRQGIAVSAYMVQRVLHEQGLRALRGTRRRPRPAGVTPFSRTIPNRLWAAGEPRTFTSARPGTRLVGDTTEFTRFGQRRYVHVILDLFDRRLLGWSLTAKPNAEGIITAMTMAIATGRLGPHPIFHSDHGSHFMSRALQTYCARHGILQSMGAKGDCYDNAVVESFFATFKGDLAGSAACGTWDEITDWIAAWVDDWYNTCRPHGWNHGFPPSERPAQLIPRSPDST